VIPNLLSIFRILLIPFILLALSRGWREGAAGLIVLSGSTDLVDGWIARRFRQITDLGKILDPLGDKLTIGAVSLFLAWTGKLPWWMVGIILTKDVVILVAGLAFWGRGRRVPVSDLWGKIAAMAVGLLILAGVLDLRGLLPPLIGLTLAAFAVSTVSYIRTYFIPAPSNEEKR
jgi:cardiolipin synthase